MDPKQIEEIVHTMRRLGVTHLKTKDLDITVAESALRPESPIAPEEEEKARQKIDQLSSLLQLSDTELLNRLFPAQNEDI